MYDTCVKALDANVLDWKRIFWVDSSTVFSRIRTTLQKFIPFVFQGRKNFKKQLVWKNLFRALGWPKLKHKRLVSTSIMMYKTVHGMTAEYLRSRFVSRDDMSSYQLRNTENKLALPQPRTNYLKKSFSYSGAKLWNSLSHDLRSAASLNHFKRKLRHHSFE